MKLDIKKQTSNKIITQAYHSRCTENYQVRPESLQTFQPSYASSKVKNENDAIRNRISDFAKATYFSTKNPRSKLATNNRGVLIAAEFHFVHSVENITSKRYSTWARDTVRWYWSADVLFWQLSIDDNIDVQSAFSWAPKVARKCESKHWYACGADGRAAGGRCTVTWLPNFLGWVDLLTLGAPQARFACQSSAINFGTPFTVVTSARIKSEARAPYNPERCCFKHKRISD